MVRIPAGAALVFALGCSASTPEPGTNSTGAPTAKPLTPAPIARAPVAPTQASPPPVDRGCTKDTDCAVARIAVTGPDACCDSCATTAGTRRWHAQLQQYCGAHPASTCGPLACPLGPTRAVCRGGTCTAVATDDRGAPVLVLDDQRCLPAMICDQWAGCAEIRGNAQDGWFIKDSSPSRSAIELTTRPIETANKHAIVIDPRMIQARQAVAPGNVCTVGAHCDAVRLQPEGVVCPPWTAPPSISAPGYRCELRDSGCRASRLP